MLFPRACLLAALLAGAPIAQAEPKPAGSGVSAPAKRGVQRATLALRQSAEGLIAPQGGDRVIAPHDRAAITAQRLADVVVALHELPVGAQTTALAKLRSGSGLSKGLAAGFTAYRAAKQRAAGDPGKMSRAQIALTLGLAKLVVDGSAAFAELGDKSATGSPHDPLANSPEPALKRAETLKPERWSALKKDAVALADRLDSLAL